MTPQALEFLRENFAPIVRELESDDYDGGHVDKWLDLADYAGGRETEGLEELLRETVFAIVLEIGADDDELMRRVEATSRYRALKHGPARHAPDSVVP
jgi:hypothetical protein